MEELQSRLYEALRTIPSLINACKLQISITNDGFIVFIRTTYELSNKMETVEQYQFPFHMITNMGHLHKAIEPLLEDKSIALYPSESMAIAMYAYRGAIRYGIRTARSKGVFIVPNLPFETYRRAHIRGDEAAIQKALVNLGLWGNKLLQHAWRTNDTIAPYIQIVHLPDGTLDELNFSHIERATNLSIGWNVAKYLGPETMAHEVTSVLTRLTGAETLVEYA